MEVRRAQGFLDEEVLVGTASDQWQLVGNGVARPMALALGLKFREAWVGSLSDDVEEPRIGQSGAPLETLSALHRFKQEGGYDTTPASASPYPSEPGELDDQMESTPATVVSNVTELAAAETPRGTKRRLSEDPDTEEHMTRRLFEGGTTPAETPSLPDPISTSRSS
jgi:DNA (cytosine-5)-methyltransferase 1